MHTYAHKHRANVDSVLKMNDINQVLNFLNIDIKQACQTLSFPPLITLKYLPPSHIQKHLVSESC